MSLVVDEHREYLRDVPRISAMRRAIHALVRPGDIVLDLGCGTGILGLMACEAGAARVYAIDHSGMIEIARAIAQRNGRADDIVHIAGHSTHVTLPEKANVLVFDQIGRFGFEAGVLEFALDARRRLLEPHARILPAAIRLEVALCVSEELRGRVDFWLTHPAGIDASPAFTTAVNTGYPVEPEEVEQVSQPRQVLEIDVSTWDEQCLTGSVELTALRDASVDGLSGWFRAELAPGVFMTNAPDAPDRILRRLVFLPFDRPMPVTRGERVTVDIKLLGADMILSWRASTADGRESRAHSTWRGMLPTREELDLARPDARPRITPRGEARRTVLELCDGSREVRDIETEVASRHPDLFANEREAAVFVAEVVSAYGVR